MRRTFQPRLAVREATAIARATLPKYLAVMPLHITLPFSFIVRKL